MLTSKELFTYHTSRNFLCFATKWTFDNDPLAALDCSSVCLVLLSGVGLTSDIWTPIVERLHNIQLQGRPFLESIWAVDRPSHGDSGVLNESALIGCQGLSPCAEYAAAFSAFLASPLLSSKERANLVIVSHSAGVAAPVYTYSECQLDPPIRSLVLIEPTVFDSSDMGIFEQWIRRTEKFIKSQKTAWTTIDEAMSTNKIWQKFHPEVRTIIANTFFRHTRGSDFSTKTSVAQEVSAFKEVALGIDIGQRLGSIIPKIPTHLIYGSRRDYWPKALDEAFFRLIHNHQHNFASVTPIAGESHFAPQEAPAQVAISIYKAVVATALQESKPVSRL
ncbi:Alpha/beta hydrolase fold-1 [Mycena maculata]|uniref:Alpha/beta hydrolase fold-1 n=1 Tax=Mycena maculata TaxID=230809 RepID=A0AAD7ILY7_9AGAR|nr:Alpha/beta hydrolase fold-1 [Mycena maculata]